MSKQKRLRLGKRCEFVIGYCVCDLKQITVCVSDGSQRSVFPRSQIMQRPSPDIFAIHMVTISMGRKGQRGGRAGGNGR
jgi:hypothetical protein